MGNKYEPAFPFPYKNREGENEYCSGISVREYIAVMAMQGLLSNDWKDYRKTDPECTLLAKVAVNYADALINALNEQP